MTQRMTYISSLSKGIVVRLAAVGLVGTSAGFSASYAWGTASKHGWFLGSLAVVFALSLEVAKPTALKQGLAEVGRLDIPRGAGLLLLALVASAYSLQCELTTFASFRADDIGRRAATIQADATAQEAQRRNADRYKALQDQLSAIAPHRSVAEVQAVITKALALNPRAGDCSKLDGPVSRAVCPNIVSLQAEIDAAKTAELVRDQLASLPVAAAPSMVNGASLGTADDPGAVALATYLQALGLTVAPTVLGSWMALIGVVALEVASLFSMLLVPTAPITSRALATVPEVTLKGSDQDRSQGPGVTPTTTALEPGTTPSVDTDQADQAADHTISFRLLERLRVHGDGLVTTTRALAADLGCANSTVCDAIRKLKDDGVVVSVANSKGKGSALKLVTA